MYGIISHNFFALALVLFSILPPVFPFSILPPTLFLFHSYLLPSFTSLMVDKGIGSDDTTTAIEGQLNPYFLHHSFGSSSTSVTQPLLGTINYTSWSRAMRMVISGKNKTGFIITNKITKPTEETLLEA